VRKFEKLISARTKKQFATSKLEDEHSEKLLKLVKKKKSNRKNIVEVEVESEAPTSGKVIDLVSVLKKSLSAKAS
jgi:non-homologous end joining protein Ku